MKGADLGLKMTRLTGLLILFLLPLAILPAAQPADPPRSDVYVVPFSHLDLYWACRQEECLSRGDRIISKAGSHGQGFSDRGFLR